MKKRTKELEKGIEPMEHIKKFKEYLYELMRKAINCASVEQKTIIRIEKNADELILHPDFSLLESIEKKFFPNAYYEWQKQLAASINSEKKNKVIRVHNFIRVLKDIQASITEEGVVKPCKEIHVLFFTVLLSIKSGVLNCEEASRLMGSVLAFNDKNMKEQTDDMSEKLIKAVSGNIAKYYNDDGTFKICACPENESVGNLYAQTFGIESTSDLISNSELMSFYYSVTVNYLNFVYKSKDNNRTRERK